MTTRTLSFAIQMDLVANIDIAGDSTFALGLEYNRAAMIYGIIRPINYPLMKEKLPLEASHYSFLITAIRFSKPETLKPAHWTTLTLY